MMFFFDENFPKAARGLLDQAGHQCLDIRGTEKEGAHDNDLFAMAQDADAVFLTTDRDFFHTIPHFYSQHCGVVVVALRQPDRKSILAKLSWFLANIAPVQYHNRVFLLLDASCAIYPPLD